MDFKNKQLEFDIEKIKGYDKPISLEKSFDDSQEVSMHILDVNDSIYFYNNEEDRDEDTKRVMLSLIE